jgi:hypothetical protein
MRGAKGALEMRKFIAVAAFAAATALASAAGAVVIPFGGVATGLDPLGETFTAANTFGAAWGEPGLGLGTLIFNPASISNSKGDWANEFDFIFLKGVTGSIDQTPASGPGGFEVTTRFSTGGVLWTPTFLNGGHEVDFIAPAGVRINPGDSFFVNVVFTGPVNANRFSFAGLWTDENAVPEPATWALMIGGFGLAGVALRARRKQAATA